MVLWTLYDALSFLKVFGTVAWTLSKQLSGRWSDEQAEREMIICCFQLTCKCSESDKAEIRLCVSIFLSFCNLNACLDKAPTKMLPVALMVSLVVQSGVVLESSIANLIGCRKNCGFSR